MLNEREQKVVENLRVWHFGAYLQWAFVEYDFLLEDLQLNGLKRFNERMMEQKGEFDEVYFGLLPEEEANPLRLEQEAWRLLSPRVKQQIDEFGQFVENYSPSAYDKEQLLTHLDASFGWIQKWNIISDSFKAKLENLSEPEITEKEQAVKKLIQELSQE